MGGNSFYIMWKHLLRNVVGSLIILATLRIGAAILAESGLSFLGLGVQIPDSSWGSLVADGKNLIRRAPWVSLIPGCVITLAVLAFNLVGDSLRDLFDPRLR